MRVDLGHLAAAVTHPGPDFEEADAGLGGETGEGMSHDVRGDYALSPDGRFVAVTMDFPDHQDGLWILNVDTGKVTGIANSGSATAQGITPRRS